MRGALPRLLVGTGCDRPLLSAGAGGADSIEVLGSVGIAVQVVLDTDTDYEVAAIWMLPLLQ